MCANSDRLHFLQDACRSFSKHGRNIDDNKFGYNVISDDANRVLFCSPPKTGSSAFKNLWLNYTRDVHGGPDAVHEVPFLRKHNLRYLNTYPRSEIQIRLKTYFKFMITRHPLLRVLSAFRQKFQKPNVYWYFRPRIGRHIEIKYGHIPSKQSTGNNVTFEQFVHFLADTDPTGYNLHWKPISMICDPCQISYDYIVKLETSYDDYPHIFAQLKNASDSKIRALDETAKHKAVTDFDLVNGYYNKIPAEYMAIFKRNYNIDMAMFGYTWNTTSMSQGCRIKTEGKECC